MRFPFAIGAVVLGWLVTSQTPLSGQVSPVLAVVPMGAGIFNLLFRKKGRYVTYSGVLIVLRTSSARQVKRTKFAIQC